MFVTNDVSLIIFVPLTILLFRNGGKEDYILPVITLENSLCAPDACRFTLNGAEVPNGYAGTATVHDGVVYASVARGGTYIIFR